MMKMKSLLCMLLALLLLTPCMALAEETDADTLQLAELTDWAARYHARALNAEPLNDPAASFTSDGYEFIYDFATLYGDTPVMSADTELSAVVITSASEEGPRGTMVDDSMQVVLSAYYHENPQLLGSHEFAVLYLMEMLPESARWGQVQRDGQRVQTIQYAVHEQLPAGGDGYCDAGVIYTLQEGIVSAIRVYGLNSRISLDEVQGALMRLSAIQGDESYRQVPFSYDGAELAMFGGEDLVMAGFDFAVLTPETAEICLGKPMDDLWMEDGENGYIRTLTFDGCEITFLYDQNKENPAVYMLLMNEEGLEGPRAVRVGDTFPEVFNRFRNGEGAFDGDAREMLYGTEEEGTFGVAEYGADASATLRYGLVLEDGRRIVMHVGFTNMTVTEVMLYVVQ